MRILHLGPIAAAALLMAPSLKASEVQYQGGRMTIRCNNENLGQLFEQIKTATGMELILDGAVKNTRLTADISGEPLNLAIERLMEGSGLNYVMLMDRADWQRVAKMFITSGGSSGATAPGRAATPAPLARRALPREAEEEPDIAPEEAAPEDFAGDAGNEDATDDQGGENAPQAPPIAAPPPNYLPAPQNFPRSSFTPGFDKNPFGGASTTQPTPGYPNGANPYGGPPGSMTTPGASPNAPPPANFPFVDAFGRPIPVNPQDKQSQNKNPK